MRKACEGNMCRSEKYVRLSRTVTRVNLNSKREKFHKIYTKRTNIGKDIIELVSEPSEFIV